MTLEKVDETAVRFGLDSQGLGETPRRESKGKGSSNGSSRIGAKGSSESSSLIGAKGSSVSSSLVGAKGSESSNESGKEGQNQSRVSTTQEKQSRREAIEELREKVGQSLGTDRKKRHQLTITI